LALILRVYHWFVHLVMAHTRSAFAGQDRSFRCSGTLEEVRIASGN